MDRKVLMLGLDALVPNILEKFVNEGILPNFKRLFKEGCFTRLLSSIPAQTPANWHTVATGAKPGTHTVTVWGAHRPDDPAPEIHRAEAFNSGLCLAEYIWETAARCGKRSIVMNYAGYPPTTDSAIHIDRLYQPARSYYDITPPTVYHTLDAGAGDKLQFEKSDGWSNLPESTLPPLSTEIHVIPASEGDGPSYFALLFAQNDGYDTLAFCEEKDAETAIFKLKPGEWSGWVRAKFNTEEMGEVEGAFRFKLVECYRDAERFRLYRSAAFPTDGRFVSKSELGEKLIENLGPYIHGVMTAQLHVGSEILDWETVDEELIDEAKWWSSAAKITMEETDAELLYLHWHLPDLIGHKFIPWVDPEGTAYTPERAKEGWKQIRNYYRAIDRFVGEFLVKFGLDETVIAIVAEHGMPANKKAVALVNVFKDKGWLKLTLDGQPPTPVAEFAKNSGKGDGVIWQESKLFFEQNHLWINLQGREPTRIVSPEEYKELRAEVQKVMRDIKDPETGEHVFSFVLTKEEAPMVGLWGEHIGDLVFCYAGGYRWAGAEVLQRGDEQVIFPCEGGNHGPMIPTYETEVASVYGTLILAGDGVRKEILEKPSRKGSRCTADVAPTLAYLLGIAPPAQNEGRVLHEFLEEFNSEYPERKLTPTARKLHTKPRPRRRIQLKGDVTDEEV